jgi:hypothetical protein
VELLPGTSHSLQVSAADLNTWVWVHVAQPVPDVRSVICVCCKDKSVTIDCCRHYFGDQVGLHLAFLNALTCWLLAPAAASSVLLWALGGLDRTGAQVQGSCALQVEARGCRIQMPEQHRQKATNTVLTAFDLRLTSFLSCALQICLAP